MNKFASLSSSLDGHNATASDQALMVSIKKSIRASAVTGLWAAVSYCNNVSGRADLSRLSTSFAPVQQGQIGAHQKKNTIYSGLGLA